MLEKENKTLWFGKLVEVMEKLRGPDGCPWDKKQTHKTLKTYLVEECAELLDAIDDDKNEDICEELGDVLMHVVLNAVIAGEKGHFDINEVAKLSAEKMIRRHPHVFSDVTVNGSEDVVDLWEKIKKQEKKCPHKINSLMDGMPRNFPALLRAEKIQKKAASVGFDWETPAQILEKIDEEVHELKEAFTSDKQENIDEEIGDLLFAVVNLVRFRKRASAEELLASANTKFIKRFKYIEQALSQKGKSLEEADIAEMEKLWQEAKKRV